jgi:hypothetical protein
MLSQVSLAIEEKTATDAISITVVTAITFSPILSLGTAANTTRWAQPPALESAGGSCPRPTSGRRRWMSLLHSWRNPCSPLSSCPCLQSCASTAKKPTVVSAEFLLPGTSGAELYIRAVNAAALSGNYATSLSVSKPPPSLAEVFSSYMLPRPMFTASLQQANTVVAKFWRRRHRLSSRLQCALPHPT